MSQALNFYQKQNVTQIEISQKQKFFLNLNVTKTEMSPKLKCPNTKMSPKMKKVMTGFLLYTTKFAKLKSRRWALIALALLTFYNCPDSRQ